MPWAVHMNAMFRALYHGRPIVNGYSAYWPAAFPERMALANRAPDPEAATRLYEETGVRTYVVPRVLVRQDPWQRALAQKDGAWRTSYEDAFHVVLEFDPSARRAPTPP